MSNMTAEQKAAASARRKQAEKSIQYARHWVVMNRPYYTKALFTSPIVQSDAIASVTMDARWRIYVNPDYAISEPTQRLGSHLIHVVNHALRSHSERAYTSAVAPGQEMVWNVACDCEINDDLNSTGLDLPEEMWFPYHFEMENDLVAERYYRDLLDEAEEIEMPSFAAVDATADPDGESGEGQAGGGEGDDESDSAADGESDDQSDSDQSGPSGSGPQTACGSVATGRTESYELSGDDKRHTGLNEYQQDLIRQATAQAVKDAHEKHQRDSDKSRGDVPAGLLRWADDLLQPKVDWRQVLSAAVKRALYQRAGDVDYSYRRTSRRQGQQHTGIIMPGMIKPIPSLSVVVDTSGSMSNTDLAQALAEVNAILKRVIPGDALQLLAVDADVGATQRAFKAKDVNLVGGGGTDMRVGIVEAAKSRPCAIIVLTDGYTPWPETPNARGSKVIAGIIGGDSAPVDSVPDWIKSVHIDI